MISQPQILTIISYILLIHQTNSDIIQCLITNTECNCPTVDTPQPCTLLCNNVDVCRTKTLNCREGDPCSINCNNSRSCTDATINTNSATDVKLICDGDQACKDVKTSCGTGDCTLQCNTNIQSCFDFESFDVTLAKSFQCTGFCPMDITLPTPFYAPTSSPTIPPSIHTISPTISTTNPTLNPSISPSDPPTKSPSYNPTQSPSQKPTKSPSQLYRLSPPTMDQIVAATSLVSTKFITMKPTDNITLTQHTMLLTENCYIIIAISIIIITCICCAAFCLVYLNHKNTQKMLIAATTTYFANVTGSYGTKSENKFYHHAPQIRSPSIILNPYQLPIPVPGSIYDLNAVNVNHSYPPAIMVHNVNNTQPNNIPIHISPPIMSNVPNNNNNININASTSPNNDAMSATSSHQDEGTSPTIIRKISDFPALPQQIAIGQGDTSVSSKLPHKHHHHRHHRHRTSLHMTPAGYMDDKCVSVAEKNKKIDDSNANSVINTPNIEMNHTLSGIAEQAIEILKLGEYDNDHKDIDVDDIDIELAAEVLSQQQSRDTDTDLSKELFQSPSHSSISKINKSKIEFIEDCEKKLDPFCYYHAVGSLPVIISPNNRYKNNITEEINIRANSVILPANISHESSPEPLQLPLLLNNNIISPLKEYSESTYNDDMDADISSKINEHSSYEESTYSSSHSGHEDYDTSNTCNSNTMKTRITRSCINYIVSDVEEEVDVDEEEDDDTYIEIVKPMSESTIKNLTESEFAFSSSIPLSANEGSETSTTTKDDDIDDEIILQHANKLMSLLQEDDANNSDNDVIEVHHHHRNCNNSISLQV